VVTGASSGLGAIFADQLAHRGLSLVLAGRDQARLSAVAQRVGQNVELLVGDLGTDAGVEALVAHLDGREIDVLVNNAGFGTYGPFAELDAAREHELLAVNVDALVRLTHAVLPGMVARRRGGVLNIASTIAFQPGPYQATYGASKAFVLSLSHALWAETRGSGVTVTALCPGPPTPVSSTRSDRMFRIPRSIGTSLHPSPSWPRGCAAWTGAMPWSFRVGAIG
jgi:short-subunit dehydrogenase